MKFKEALILTLILSSNTFCFASYSTVKNSITQTFQSTLVGISYALSTGYHAVADQLYSLYKQPQTLLAHLAFHKPVAIITNIKNPHTQQEIWIRHSEKNISSTDEYIILNKMHFAFPPSGTYVFDGTLLVNEVTHEKIKPTKKLS